MCYYDKVVINIPMYQIDVTEFFYKKTNNNKLMSICIPSKYVKICSLYFYYSIISCVWRRIIKFIRQISITKCTQCFEFIAVCHKCTLWKSILLGASNWNKVQLLPDLMRLTNKMNFLAINQCEVEWPFIGNWFAHVYSRAYLCVRLNWPINKCRIGNKLKWHSSNSVEWISTAQCWTFFNSCSSSRSPSTMLKISLNKRRRTKEIIRRRIKIRSNDNENTLILCKSMALLISITLDPRSLIKRCCCTSFQHGHVLHFIHSSVCDILLYMSFA